MKKEPLVGRSSANITALNFSSNAVWDRGHGARDAMVQADNSSLVVLDCGSTGATRPSKKPSTGSDEL
jgi:hypothetical protein